MRREERAQPSAAPLGRLIVPAGSRARSVIDKLIVHFHLNAFRVDTLARKGLPRLAVPLRGCSQQLGQTPSLASGWRV